MNTHRKTYEIGEGDLLHIGTSFFYVREVREPRHPLFPGLTFVGYWWRQDLGHWGAEYTLPAEHDKPWNVANDALSLFPQP